MKLSVFEVRGAPVDGRPAEDKIIHDVMDDFDLIAASIKKTFGIKYVVTNSHSPDGISEYAILRCAPTNDNRLANYPVLNFNSKTGNYMTFHPSSGLADRNKQSFHDFDSAYALFIKLLQASIDSSEEN